MRQLLSEIVRQKWRSLTVVMLLLLLNLILSIVISVYQLPSIEALQTKWIDLRKQFSSAGQVDSATLYKQGAADLAKLKAKITEKREFARLLSDLYDAAASSAVEVGTISYKPVTVKNEGLISYQLSLAVNGSYAAVKSYLADLQSNSGLLVVDSVSFSNNDLFGENVVMDLRITVYLREAA